MAGKPTYQELSKKVRVLAAEVQALKTGQQSLEENFESLAENAYFGIFIMGDEGVVYSNPKALGILGYTPEEVKAESLPGLATSFHPDDMERFLQRHRDGMAGKTLEPVQEYRLYKKDGLMIWVETAATAVTFDRKPAWMVMYRDITQRKKLEQALQKSEEELKTSQKNLKGLVEKRTEELGESNIALKILLQRQTEGITEFERKVVFNVKELIQPYVGKLKKSRLNKSQKTWLDILETNLDNIISPLVHGISLEYLKFTPTEIQVANFVKQGKATTQIAEVLNLSEKTIGYHRDNIRKKVGIRNRKINLRTYLLSMK